VRWQTDGEGGFLYTDIRAASNSASFEVIHAMDATAKTPLVIALAIVALLLLFFGGGMTTGTMMSGGYMGSGSMGGFSWMWLPTLLIFVLGIALFSAIAGKK
jgi:hypothetical protein